jgi:hypothetical protein
MRFHRIKPLLLLAAALLMGCAGGSGAGTAGPLSMPPPMQEAKEGDLAVNPNDPCVLNLGAIIENLIIAYGRRHVLPASLDKLGPTSVTGEKISLTCPQTGKPYVYVPQGIHPPPELQPAAPLLILYDAEPAHPSVRHFAVGNDVYDLKQTVRYGIVLRPAPAGQPVAMYVVPIDEKLLKAYLTAPQPGH